MPQHSAEVSLLRCGISDARLYYRRRASISLSHRNLADEGVEQQLRLIFFAKRLYGNTHGSNCLLRNVSSQRISRAIREFGKSFQRELFCQSLSHHSNALRRSWFLFLFPFEASTEQRNWFNSVSFWINYEFHELKTNSMRCWIQL